MNKSEVLSAFNNHIGDFFTDVSMLFPDNNDIKIAHTSLNALRVANPRIIINIWKKNIVDIYKDKILEGNIDFFINKNYKSDLINHNSSNMILDKIDTLREPIRQMGEENQKKTIQYLQNLTKIYKLYYQE